MLKRVLVETDIKISEQHLFEIVHYIYNVNDIHCPPKVWKRPRKVGFWTISA